MIGKVRVTSHIPFELDGKQPKRLYVRCTSAPADARKTYSVFADYGWTEEPLCSSSYLNHANDIAQTIADGLLCPVELAKANAT